MHIYSIYIYIYIIYIIALFLFSHEEPTALVPMTDFLATILFTKFLCFEKFDSLEE